ncbi:MAG: hypothetical protein ACXU9A_20440, partial [Xanthobacteraceae bacterium]
MRALRREDNLAARRRSSPNVTHGAALHVPAPVIRRKTPMKRREFLKVAGAGMAGSAVAAPAIA